MALRRNILLFHQGALGDFVVTWPVALGLARVYAQSRLFYVTHSEKGKLADKVLRVEWADAEAGWNGLFGPAGSQPALPEVSAKLLAGAQMVVGFLSGSSKAWADNVRRLAPEANVLVINPTPPDEWKGHATEYQLEQLLPWPAAHAAAEQMLRSDHTRGVSVQRPNPPTRTVIHPGSGSPLKNWPVERYLELAGILSGQGHDVRILIGEVEQERWTPDVLARLSAVGSLARPATYLELLAELQPARVFIGNDSGPGHLAGILGVPTLSLFGPTDPARWKPLGPHVRTIRREPMDDLDVRSALAEVQTLLA